ncbi:putative acetyltransferase [Ciceribacter lividus]|uniref:Putative acetyltransferase n=1 Tax=Ciceribacter lividus TaxID=1197950 RepID=A0A6I7HRL5_9HYPH|nr:GNAT family N-acetyltransferase [Ciceribacter lividus]RCW28374.1 putative acetyltransferase [Ciceribacter lividus]
MSLQNPSSSAPSNWPDGLQIRARTATDVAGLADLHNMPGCRSGTLRLPYQSADDVRRAIEAQGSSVTALVAVMDGRIVGDVGLHGFQGRRAHAGMIGMGVHDDYIRRGIGRALLSEIVRIADEWLNIRRLELTVFIDNAGAIALYESFGFEREGMHRAFAFRGGRYVDALAMARFRPE